MFKEVAKQFRDNLQNIDPKCAILSEIIFLITYLCDVPIFIGVLLWIGK